MPTSSRTPWYNACKTIRLVWRPIAQNRRKQRTSTVTLTTVYLVSSSTDHVIGDRQTHWITFIKWIYLDMSIKQISTNSFFKSSKPWDCALHHRLICFVWQTHWPDVWTEWHSSRHFDQCDVIIIVSLMTTQRNPLVIWVNYNLLSLQSDWVFVLTIDYSSKPSHVVFKFVYHLSSCKSPVITDQTCTTSGICLMKELPGNLSQSGWLPTKDSATKQDFCVHSTHWEKKKKTHFKEINTFNLHFFFTVILSPISEPWSHFSKL